MADFVWRSRSRLVAFCDLILISLALVVLTLGILAISGVTAELVNLVHNGEIDKPILNAALWIVWPAVAISGVIIFVRFWLVMNLVKATEVTLDSFKALEFSRNWRNFNVVLLVITSAINLFLLDFIKYSLVLLAVRLLFLYVVQQFIKELEVQTMAREHRDTPVSNPESQEQVA